MPTVVSTAVSLPTPEATSLPKPTSTKGLNPTFTPLPSPTASAVPSATPISTATLIPTATSTRTPAYGEQTILGASVQGRALVAYRFGVGERHLVFVGGIHGGYEWNTITLALQMVDYLQANPAQLPEDVTVWIVPSANPDGQYLITGSGLRFEPEDVVSPIEPGRFNANGVDLNRNWDCNWQPVAIWREQSVLAGDEPFSEPETRVLRDFIMSLPRVDGVIFWHSAANGIFPSHCGAGQHQPSQDLATVYSRASGYPLYSGGFTSYPITGDAGDWLTMQGIPSITIELRNHLDDDWQQNLQGTLTVIADWKLEN